MGDMHGPTKYDVLVSKYRVGVLAVDDTKSSHGALLRVRRPLEDQINRATFKRDGQPSCAVLDGGVLLCALLRICTAVRCTHAITFLNTRE